MKPCSPPDGFECSWLVRRHQTQLMCGWKRSHCSPGPEFVLVRCLILINAVLYVFSVFPFQAHVFLEEAMLLITSCPRGAGPLPCCSVGWWLGSSTFWQHISLCWGAKPLRFWKGYKAASRVWPCAYSARLETLKQSSENPAGLRPSLESR